MYSTCKTIFRKTPKVPTKQQLWKKYDEQKNGNEYLQYTHIQYFLKQQKCRPCYFMVKPNNGSIQEEGKIRD